MMYNQNKQRLRTNLYNLIDNMHARIYSIVLVFIGMFACALSGAAQEADTTIVSGEKPVILYSTPQRYEIADIKVEGADNYEDYAIIGLSGLSKGQVITIPGDEVTQACKRYWRHGLFSDVSITADKIERDKVWLTIHLTMSPRVSDIRYHGVKKSERDDLESKIGMIKGSQINMNAIDRAKTLIKRYFDDKGFKNAEVIIDQKEDPAKENQVIVDINIDKKEKIKVDRITGHGGLFKTKGVGQRVLAAALGSPISIMETAGEGGAWGIALLASYAVNNDKRLSLAEFLEKNVFAGNSGTEIAPTAEDIAGFNAYIEKYKAGLPIEEAAVKFKE